MATTLKRPLIRRIGNLVVRIDEDGIEIRGHRKRRWWSISWARLAYAACTAVDLPLIVEGEEEAGRRYWYELTASNKQKRLDAAQKKEACP